MRTKMNRDTGHTTISNGMIGFLAAAMFAGGIAIIVLNSMSYAL